MTDWNRRRVQPTPEQTREVLKVMDDLAETGFETDADEAFVLWWRTPSGQVQPVIWPMVLHQHTHECFRA